MDDKRIIADPQMHYGSPKGATRAFSIQRITGALNVLFLAFFIWLVVGLAGADRAQMVATVAHPVVALVLALLLVNVALHMRTGMREVIEDYVHGRTGRLALLINDIFVLGVLALGLISLIKIVFWG